MLARRTIRTKLMIVMGLMLAVVVLLASSAFWGLSRYRGLADAISRQADEIAYTNRLSRGAASLRDICHRLSQLTNQKSPVDDSLLFGQRFEMEQENLDMALLEFSRVLESYQRRSSDLRPSQLLFIDPEERLARADAMTQQLNRAWVRYSQPAYLRDAAWFAILQQDLDLLAAETEALTTLLHEGMKAFSSEVRGEYRTWIAVAWGCLFAAFTMFCVLCGLFHSLVVKPFRTLLDGSRLVAAGQFAHRIYLGTGDELSELADVVNKMTQKFQDTFDTLERERKDLDRQVRDRTREVVQREQLASVGFLAAGVAHEINNPLASIAWSAEALESRLHDAIHGPGETREIAAEQAEILGENLRRIQDEAYRCKGITERLLDFSRLGNVERSRVDICELVRDVVAMVGTLGQYRCKRLRTDCADSILAFVNGQQIRQVALNLITNALESVDTDGAVDVRVRRQDAVVIVTVEDDGCGMNEEVLEHLFEPFFTRRRDGSGTGLGLSITHRIVTQHGGKLTAHSDGPSRGSRLQFELPIEPATSEVAAPQATGEEALSPLASLADTGSAATPSTAADVPATSATTSGRNRLTEPTLTDITEESYREQTKVA